jgi:hypothetical protein
MQRFARAMSGTPKAFDTKAQGKRSAALGEPMHE